MRAIPSSLTGLENTLVGYTYSLSLNGNYAYLAGHAHGVGIFDISNPPKEKIIKIIEPKFGRIYDVVKNGNYLYMLEDGYLITVDISDPTKPRYIDTDVYGGRGNGMVLRGKYLYILGGWAPLYIYDISNPANPVTVTKWSARINSGPYFDSNGYLNVGKDNEYLILDVSDLKNIKIIGNYTANKLIYGGFITVGNYTYMNDNNQFKILDISNPSNIHIVGSKAIIYSTFPETRIYGNYAITMSGASNISVIDITDKSNPVLLKENIFNNVKHLFVYNNYLIATSYTKTEIYDLNKDAINLIPEKKYDFAGIPYLDDKYLYISDEGYNIIGLTIYSHNLLNASAYQSNPKAVSGRIVSTPAPSQTPTSFFETLIQSMFRMIKTLKQFITLI
jgi:hypothetical protein